MTSLMQRKARTGREAQAARAMSLGRALRLTAAKQGEQLMSLALGVLGVTRRDCSATETDAFLEAPSLILMMDGPGTQVAAAILDPSLVIGLIQQQTMGKIRPAQEGDDARALTPTDAALCAPFIESLLRQSAHLPDDEAERRMLSGYRFGVWAQGARQAKLALEANDYQVIEMTLDMAGGARVGKLVLILPEPLRQPVEVEDTQEPAAAPAPQVTLGQNVLGLQADLTVALTRIKLPLQQISVLKVGDVLDLNLSTMAQALVIDANGRAVSRGTLGQIDGVRAVQVEQKQGHHYAGPRRRASDRAELDLPDVTGGAAPAQDRRAPSDAEDVDLPDMADVDIFGSLDDLPDLPDLPSEGDDAPMTQWHAEQDEDAPEDLQKQAGW